MPTRNLSDEEREAVGSWCHEEMIADGLIVPEILTTMPTQGENEMENVDERDQVERCLDCGQTSDEGACVYCKMD